MSDLLTRVRDLESTESRLVQAAATGLFTVVVSPRRLRGRPMTTLHTVSGLVGVAGGALVAGESASPGQRALVGGAVGAAAAGASVLGMAADRRVEEWLRDRGVRFPRLWLGILAGVLTWASTAPDHEFDPKGGAAADHR